MRRHDRDERRDLLAEIGNRLRLLRLLRNIPQSEIALRAGVTQSAISNYERGKREMTIAVALRVVEAFDVSLTDIVNGSDVTNSAPGDWVPRRLV